MAPPLEEINNLLFALIQTILSSNRIQNSELVKNSIRERIFIFLSACDAETVHLALRLIYNAPEFIHLNGIMLDKLFLKSSNEEVCNHVCSFALTASDTRDFILIVRDGLITDHKQPEW